jgi:hypothetical protein
MNQEKNRRAFLQKCGRSALALSTGSLWLSSCQSAKTTVSKSSKASKVNPCEDLTGVSEVDVEKRKALGYVSLSSMPDKQCDACKLWVPVPEGKECGGCLLFTGPVAPEGNCTYWAPQV